MFITRSSRHDKTDLKEFLAAHGESEDRVDEGRAMIARDGTIVGCVGMVEVESNTVVIHSVVVADGRRGEGIGRGLVQAAMNNIGGSLYLTCHEDALRFYSHFGFEPIELDAAPESVRSYWERNDDYPTEPGHVHHYLRAR